MAQRRQAGQEILIYRIAGDFPIAMTLDSEIAAGKPATIRAIFDG
jgi:hypothetical protein